MTKADPFQQFRKSVAGSYTATTAPDGLSLTLVALDLAAFHPVAHAVIEVANRLGWATEIEHRVPGANIASLTVAPRR